MIPQLDFGTASFARAAAADVNADSLGSDPLRVPGFGAQAGA